MKKVEIGLLIFFAYLYFPSGVLGQFNASINYRIVARHSGKVLDVFDGSDADGAVIQQYSLHGAPNQTWQIEPVGNEYYRITSQQSHKVITVMPPGSLHARIVQYHWSGSDNQQWKIEPAGLDEYYLIAKNGGCMDIPSGSTDDRVQAQLYTCHGGDNQTWRIEALEDLQPVRTVRKALLIANETYSKPFDPLPGVIKETKDLSDKLKGFGYEIAHGDLYSNLPKDKMLEVIGNFISSLKPEDTALFYYAGHGMQLDAQNYLIPSGADIESADDIDEQSVLLDQDLLKPLGNRPRGVNIIILDACRDNPLNISLKGLTIPSAPANTYIAYAAAPGATTENPSPFSKSLLEHINEPGVRIEDVFAEVRQDVIAKTGVLRGPTQFGTLTSGVYFRDPVSIEVAIQEIDLESNDDVMVIVNNVEVMSWRRFKYKPQKIWLRNGYNKFEIRVFNSIATTDKPDGITRAEGWKYTVSVRSEKGDVLELFSDHEDHPPLYGTRHGWPFTVVRATIYVERSSGLIKFTSEYKQVWNS